MRFLVLTSRRDRVSPERLRPPGRRTCALPARRGPSRGRPARLPSRTCHRPRRDTELRQRGGARAARRASGRRPRRHFRTSNTRYLELTRPAGVRDGHASPPRTRSSGNAPSPRRGLRRRSRRASPQALDGPIVVLDVCDSATLTAERARRSARHRRRARPPPLLARRRAQASDRALLHATLRPRHRHQRRRLRSVGAASPRTPSAPFRTGSTRPTSPAAEPGIRRGVVVLGQPGVRPEPRGPAILRRRRLPPAPARSRASSCACVGADAGRG